jgi:hypothetical protein
MISLTCPSPRDANAHPSACAAVLAPVSASIIIVKLRANRALDIGDVCSIDRGLHISTHSA